MKLITTILLIGIGFFGNAQSDSTMIKFQRSLSIQDITETLSECNCMIMGMRGELNEKEAKLASRGQALIFGREFNELDSLYKNGNDIIQLYAFGGICMTYPDSLTEIHLEILNKEGEISIYQQQGTDEFPKMPISKVAGQMYKVVARNKKEKEIQLLVEKKIIAFIKEYSLYPNTYESIEFKDYHVYSTHNGSSLEKIENSEIPSVEHIFKIKNKEGTLDEYSARFKLDNELNIMLIEEEESGTVSCSPPRLDWWLERFGRELTDEDKTKLGLNK
jgi:hypothetical protein